MRFVEFGIFLSLAATVHLGIWSLGKGPDGATSAGNSGQHHTTIAAATDAQKNLVARWSRPPEASLQPVSLPKAPVSLETDAPRLPQTPSAPILNGQQSALEATPSKPDLPQLDTSTPKPPETVKPEVVQRPPTRPASPQHPTAKTDSAAQNAQTAQGSAKSAQKGAKGKSDLNNQSAAVANALRARWGSAIYAQIRRNMRFPRGVSGGGTTKVSLRVASNGKLHDLRLLKSSGNTALDKAALKAVSGAGRFKRAPKGLEGDTHDFNLSLTFAN